MSNQPSRRTFLKTSAATAAAASTLSIARSAHAAYADDTIKVGLVGCGGRGRGAVGNRLAVGDNCEIVAVADAFEDKANKAADMISGMNGVEARPEVFSGFNGYKQVIDSCDQVLIATSPGFRPVHHKYAIEQDKHVFMEKPCCVDAPGYRMLMETNKLADEKGLNVVVGLQRRHDPKYINTVEQIWDGAIGDVMYSRVYWNGGGVWVRGREPEQTEMAYQMNNWYYFNWLCGDHICEQHVHNMDIANWIAGKGDVMKQHPVKANGQGGRQVRKGPDVGQIFDHHFIEFTYEDGSQMFSQCRHIRNCWNSVSEHIYGTEGYAQPGNIKSSSGKGAETIWSERNSAGVENKYTGKAMKNPYDIEHLNLVNAIRDGGHINDGYHGAQSSFTAVFGRMATYSGKELTWDEAVASGREEFPYEAQLAGTLDFDSVPPVLPVDGSYESTVAMPGIYNPYK